jgi:hypothetical protein
MATDKPGARNDGLRHLEQAHDLEAVQPVGARPQQSSRSFG